MEETREGGEKRFLKIMWAEYNFLYLGLDSQCDIVDWVKSGFGEQISCVPWREDIVACSSISAMIKPKWEFQNIKKERERERGSQST